MTGQGTITDARNVTVRTPLGAETFDHVNLYVQDGVLYVIGGQYGTGRRGRLLGLFSAPYAVTAS